MFGFDTTWDYLVKVTGRKVLTDHQATNFWMNAEKFFDYKDFSKDKRCLGNKHSH